jgi:hypothetical protein
MREPQAELACRTVVELITEYLDDALPDGERRRLEEHLADCDGCTVVLDQFRTTVTVTGRLAEDDVDRLHPGTREQLLGVFRRWSAGRDGGADEAPEDGRDDGRDDGPDDVLPAPPTV